jgi:hypothetical protein
MTKHEQVLPEHSRTVPRKRTDKADAAFDQAQPLDPRAILQRAALAPASLRPADILRLQQTIGNQAVARLLSQLSPVRSVVHAKLTINAPGDEYEREADRVADALTRVSAVQRAVRQDDEEPQVMTKRGAEIRRQRRKQRERRRPANLPPRQRGAMRPAAAVGCRCRLIRPRLEFDPRWWLRSEGLIPRGPIKFASPIC